MDSAYISALFGLAGAIVGGLASFSTTWLTQSAQLRERRREVERNRREQLFDSFITEATRLYGDALSHEKDDVADLVLLYAIVSRMRLTTSRTVVEAAERVLDVIVDTYLAPNRTLHELHHLARDGGMNFLGEFAETCRVDLLAATYGRR